jgi:formamidopyrimidine-DNA glycosylase
MPELPDIDVYLESLRRRILGRRLNAVRLRSPFLLRTFEPPLEQCQGREVVNLHRVGKRLAIELDGGLILVLHLMIAGRLHWKAAGTSIANRSILAAFDFDVGSLILTEAGSKKRASLHVFQGIESLRRIDPGGLEPLECTEAEFIARLRSENHTLKRALTDPRLFAGIGNSYSDEILHDARLSPVALTSRLQDQEARRLHQSVVHVLTHWRDQLQREAGDEFPENVTAFRPGMAVHGRYGLPCPDCGTAVQRIRYAENETNYCPRCQTGGKVLADRSLSRLLKNDWPRTIEELEEQMKGPASS